jgi:type II secretory pathway component PulF
MSDVNAQGSNSTPSASPAAEKPQKPAGVDGRQTKPLESKLSGASTSSHFTGFFKKILSPVNFQEKINFARHLSVCIKSSMPVLEALRLIRRQTKSRGFGNIVDASRLLRRLENMTTCSATSS